MPNDNNKSPYDITARYYAVAFIDLLSQNDRLRDLKRLPIDMSSLQEFEQKAKGTFGEVIAFREYVHDFVQALQESSEDNELLPSIPDQLRPHLARLNKIELRVEFFSDCAILYSALDRREPIAFANGLLGMLLGCGLLLNTFMSNGIFVRGGIDIGIAAMIAEGSLYGPALGKAYEIECEHAEYPRIVIGTDVRTILHQFATINEANIEEAGLKFYANECLALIKEVSKDLFMLDFLSPQIMIYQGNDEFISMTQKAFIIISSEIERFRASGNTKLLERYIRLQDYYRTSCNEYVKDL